MLKILVCVKQVPDVDLVRMDPETGNLGPIYGVQWRSWPAPTPDDPHRVIDQIGEVLRQLRTQPDQQVLSPRRRRKLDTYGQARL